MRLFKDRTGEEWEIDVTVGSVKRVRDLLKIDLVGLVEDGCQGLSRLLADPVAVCDVLYALCYPQAKERKLRDLDFGDRMTGEALEPAAEALVGALVDFFPRDKASALRAMLAKGREVGDRILAAALKDLEGVDPDEAAAAALKELRSKLGTFTAPSVNAPDGSDSATGDTSPSGS